jgi:hypothetical protein
VRLYAFCACRCFRSELRRVRRAFAARTASFLVNLAFETDALGRDAVLESGIAGSTGAGIVELRSTGWTLIGPGYRRLPFCIDDNAWLPNLFDTVALTEAVRESSIRGRHE